MLTKDAVNELDLETCQQLLNNSLSNPQIYLPLIDHPELLASADQLSNDICFLEDRIVYLRQVENLERANDKRWGRE